MTWIAHLRRYVRILRCISLFNLYFQRGNMGVGGKGMFQRPIAMLDSLDWASVLSTFLCCVLWNRLFAELGIWVQSSSFTVKIWRIDNLLFLSLPFQGHSTIYSLPTVPNIGYTSEYPEGHLRNIETGSFPKMLIQTFGVGLWNLYIQLSIEWFCCSKSSGEHLEMVLWRTCKHHL